jgi:hypothetical protein
LKKQTVDAANFYRPENFMTEHDASTLYEFLHRRICGWDIVLAAGDSDRLDMRTKQSIASITS